MFMTSYIEIINNIDSLKQIKSHKLLTTDNTVFKRNISVSVK